MMLLLTFTGEMLFMKLIHVFTCFSLNLMVMDVAVYGMERKSVTPPPATASVLQLDEGLYQRLCVAAQTILACRFFPGASLREVLEAIQGRAEAELENDLGNRVENMRQVLGLSSQLLQELERGDVATIIPLVGTLCTHIESENPEERQLSLRPSIDDQIDQLQAQCLGAAGFLARHVARSLMRCASRIVCLHPHDE